MAGVDVVGVVDAVDVVDVVDAGVVGAGVVGAGVVDAGERLRRNGRGCEGGQGRAEQLKVEG